MHPVLLHSRNSTSTNDKQNGDKQSLVQTSTSPAIRTTILTASPNLLFDITTKATSAPFRPSAKPSASTTGTTSTAVILVGLKTSWPSSILRQNMTHTRSVTGSQDPPGRLGRHVAHWHKLRSRRN
ncbi:hypothetical protein BGZ90_001070 [Linnemannia elongata]|nr:hypothetical protein BGZ90_001070 [Linnemannia elongata]